MEQSFGGAWSARVVVPEEHAPAFEAVFAGLTDVVSQYEDPAAAPDAPRPRWWVEGLFATRPPAAEIAARIAVVAAAAGLAEPQLTVVEVPARVWLAENVASFPPLTAGRFFIHGDHVPGPYPAGKWRLVINAATAFGSGEHASTFGCLLALDALARRASARSLVAAYGALDMGCGSGILALAMARSWPMARRIIAADIDPEAVRVTRFNAGVNGLRRKARTVLSDGPAGCVIGRRRQYAVITANILARPLRAMSRDLARRLAPGGRLILAGLLRRQESMVLSAYRVQGLRLERRISQYPWSIVVLRR